MDLSEIIEILNDQVRKYRNMDDAVAKFPIKSVDQVLLAKARAEIEAELEKVYGNPKIGVVGVPKHRWYKGPVDPSVNWKHFVERLTSDPGWTSEAIGSLDVSSSRILSFTTSPELQELGANGESGRGLVLGYVQSGKTTSFTSVIAKAVDSGYRLIVVLSGVTNNLRSQTQVAVEEMLAPMDSIRFHWLTNRDMDFRKSNNASQLLTSSVVIAVVKKNASRLNKLVEWLESATPNSRGIAPMLVIDDEADQASVNTLKAKNRVTKINAKMKELLNTKLMPLNSYVGYTATPFANLFIDPNDTEDLFPRDFLYSLDKGAGYFGPEELFGRDPIDEDDHEAAAGLPILRFIEENDIADLGTAANPSAKHKGQITNQLREALNWFVVASAIRRVREQKTVWTSMLIHTSGRIASHQEMHQMIEAQYVKEANNDFSKFLVELRATWEREKFVVFGTNLMPEWDAIEAEIPKIWEKLRLVTDNSKSLDRLDYGSHEASAPVIAIGGNTLSRGLVLKGLISTYFLRTAKGYDALLQMGRWFGYRNGYQDLQRIWMPAELADWFRFLAMIEMEIRQQISGLQAGEFTPKDLPVLIRTHPKMQITSRPNTGVPAKIGFSGKRIETILFRASDKNWLQGNLQVGRDFVTKLSAKYVLERDIQRGVPLFRGVSADEVIGFLGKYEFVPEAKIVLREPIIDYVNRLRESDHKELEQWDVFLYGPNSSENPIFEYSNDVKIKKSVRSKLNSGAESANIHHLANSLDIAVGLPDSATVKVKELSRKGFSLSKWNELRDEYGLAGRGLIGLYIVDKDSKPKKIAGKSSDRLPLDGADDLLGITIFFPRSKSKTAQVTYVGPPPLVTDVLDEDLDDLIEEADSEDEVAAENEPKVE